MTIKKGKMAFSKKFFIDKKIYAIGALLLVILLATITIISHATKKDELLKMIFDPENPIAYQNEGKFGYLDSTGEVLIEAKYATAEPFYGQFAVVSMQENDEQIYKVIDKNDKIVVSTESSNKPRFYTDYGIWLIDNKLYTKKMEKIFDDDYHIEYIGKGYFSYLNNKDTSSGIIDHRGKKVFSWNEDYITASISHNKYDEKSNYAAINNFEERDEIISLVTGKSIYTLENSKDYYLEVEDDNVFRIISRENNYKTARWMYIENDKIAYSSEDDIYDITIDDYKRGIIRIDYGISFETIGKTNSFAYYDTKKEEYLDEKYGREESTNKNDWMQDVYGYKTYTCSGQYGLMKKDKILLDCTHTAISFLDIKTYNYLKQYHKKPLTIVNKDAKIALYDMRKKKESISYEPASIEEIEESTFFIITEFEKDGFTKKNFVVYNAITGLSKKFPTTHEIKVHSNYITVSDGSLNTYYTTEFKEIYKNEI